MSCLIAFGGPPGAGKTTVAYRIKALMPQLSDALIMEGDQVRREMLGHDLSVTMQERDYSEEVSRKVRNICDERTTSALRAGRIVVDTSGFWGEKSRDEVKALALSCGARFLGIWFEVPRAVLIERIERREKERLSGVKLTVERGHASDADTEVLKKYDRVAPPSAPDDWMVFDASDEGGIGALIEAINLTLKEDL